MKKRVYRRIKKRLETEYWTGEDRFRGITSNISERGFFIRTQNVFSVGLTVNAKITLPDGNVCFVRGIVRNATKLPIKQSNGMGIELLQADLNYIDYIKSLDR
jgi:hypothetical protein